MDEATNDDGRNTPTRRDRRRNPPSRRGLSIMGVLGELFITVGVIALLYVSWQLWIGDLIIGAQFKDEAKSLSEQWASQEPTEPPTSSAQPTAPNEPPVADPIEPTPVEAPILAEPAEGEIFGIMRIPRLGPDYFFNMAGGVDASVTLNPIGIGHYPGTSMPGATGNFAVAGHRGSHGAPFQDLPALRVNDAIVVETADGWYTYRFRNLEYVQPDQVEVLLPVPQVDDATATDKLITMTTCSPRYGFSERVIAYGVFESFTPRSAGPPASLTEGVTA
ncbi:class E sortase [Microbacterium sp. zg.B48]|uniref:class E sortase n=1 Tax=unclassified Microbacterium TaxID=2609290 RepID=UPI00214BCF50|nr:MULTISPECIES: class E sortase [unclassified Microbacterium]MCR2762735.1 class E sortase [Microbacterium sp. zg.B48]MCR2808292.1 class E sortase [Microbacterium sp. zg.B185]WIM19253.1 class E sortase [Microbacterium sp. zg-B185]